MPSKEKSKSHSVPPHSHCKVCGKAIPVSKEHCSNECRGKEEKGEKRAKRMTKIYTTFFVVLMIVLVIFSLLGSPGPS